MRERVQEAALVVAEFLIRLNIRPTATPDVREAAAMEILVGATLAPENPQ